LRGLLLYFLLQTATDRFATYFEHIVALDRRLFFVAGGQSILLLGIWLAFDFLVVVALIAMMVVSLLFLNFPIPVIRFDFG